MGTNLNNGEVVEAPPGSSRTPSGCAASPAPLPRPPPHLGMVVPAGSHVTPLPTEGQFPAGPRPIPAIRSGSAHPVDLWGPCLGGAQSEGFWFSGSRCRQRRAGPSSHQGPSWTAKHVRFRKGTTRAGTVPWSRGVEVRVSGVRSSNLPTTFARSWGPAGMRRAGDAFFHFSLRFWSGN